MSGLLQDRIASYLLDHPNRSVRQIAGDLRAREASVRAILGSSGLFCQHDGPGKAVTFTLGIAPAEPSRCGPSRREGAETDCDFLYRVLSDGKPHNLNEILRRSFAERGCGLTVHSRAAELRRDRGLEVANWKDGKRGDGSWYRLVALEEVRRAADGEAAPRLASSSVPAAPTPPGSDPCQQRDARTLGGLSVSPHREPGAQTAETSSDLGADRVGVVEARGGQLTFAAPEFRKRVAA
jgi:hypothetical protein